MKTLVRRVLEKAASEGGEEWLRRCLAELGAVPELEDPLAPLSAPGMDIELVPLPPANPASSQRSESRKLQRSLPLERPGSSAASGQVEESCPHEEEAGVITATQHSGRCAQKRRAAFPLSPIRVSEGRGESATIPATRKSCSSYSA